MTAAGSRVVVAGAGLAGPLVAKILARRGYTVDVYERRPDPRCGDVNEGRSINLALCERGLAALETAGLRRTVERCSVPMRSRAIHDEDGEVYHQTFGRSAGEHLAAVERMVLCRQLIDAAAAEPGVTFHFDVAIRRVDVERRQLIVHDNRSDRSSTVPFDRLIGADGANSVVREALVGAGARFWKERIPVAYKELSVTADAGRVLHPESLHIWPRGHYFMIANPNLDGSFTCTLFLPERGAVGLDAVRTAGDVRDLFARDMPDALRLMPDVGQQFAAQGVGRIGNVRGGPWHVGDHVLLLGDAAHAIVPYLGQGVNASFEDCATLARLLEVHDDRWGPVVEDFVAERVPEADAVRELAMRNREEISEHVRSPEFRLAKQVEAELMRRHPGRFVTTTVLVRFSSAPFSLITAWAEVERALLHRICAGATCLTEVDWSGIGSEVTAHAHVVSRLAAEHGVRLADLGLTDLEPLVT